MIKAMKDAIQKATGLHPKPVITDSADYDQIIYSDYPVTDDGAKTIHSLEIRLITKTFSDAEIYRKQIIGALVPVGDNVLIDKVTACEVNGGGMLYEGNTRTYHTMLYFSYVTRSENRQ